MFTAILENIQEIIPVIPESEDDWGFKIGIPQRNTIYYLGLPRNSAEKGKIKMRFQHLEGDLQDAIYIAFLTKSGALALRGYLLDSQAINDRIGEVTVFVDDIMEGGFKNTIALLLDENACIIGITEAEFRNIHTPGLQLILLNTLLTGILPGRKQEILALVHHCFVLDITGDRVSGGSHFMGKGKLPEDAIPPATEKGAPLFHLATLHVGDFLPLARKYGLMEAKKYLSFFIDIQGTEEGWPQETDRSKVYYYDTVKVYNDKRLRPWQEEPHAIGFLEMVDIPDEESAYIYNIGLSEEEKEWYRALRASYKTLVLQGKEEAGINKLFGYPDNIQYCVAYEAESQRNNSGDQQEIHLRAAEWILLLQIDPYKEPFKFFEHFGDGTIYFMIQKNDLAKGNFSNIQVVVQHT